MVSVQGIAERRVIGIGVKIKISNNDITGNSSRLGVTKRLGSFKERKLKKESDYIPMARTFTLEGIA